MGCTDSSGLFDDEEDEVLSSSAEFKDLPNVTKLKSNQKIEDLFEITKELGRGGSCRVLQVLKKSTKQKMAMKELLIDDEWNPILFKQEIHYLTTLRHPNILEYCEAYVGSEYFYICTTLCTGGELFEEVRKLRHFSEKHAAEILEVILTALTHIHKNKIVHRDLKPENIVYDKPDGKIVLIDFGDCAEIKSNTQSFTDFVGTPFYLAPECVRHRSGWELYKSDCWAVGVIAYVLLTGRPPFWGKNNKEILTKITTGGVVWPKKVKLSRSCKHFILSLLQKDPRRRMSAEAALKHPWIVNEASKNTRHLGDEVLRNIANYINACKLKKLIVQRLVNDLTLEEKAIIAEAFKQLDYNGDGVIDKQELKKFLLGTGLSRSEAEKRTDELFMAMDTDNSGTIDLNEFIVGKTVDRLTSDTNIMNKIFKDLDEDGNGEVTAQELIHAFKDNELFDINEIKQIIKEIDKNGDGQISVDEFKKAMMQSNDD